MASYPVEIYQSVMNGDGYFERFVEIHGLHRFSSTIYGIDEINCLKCCILYIEAISK
jgi:hypothetical protein